MREMRATDKRAFANLLLDSRECLRFTRVVRAEGRLLPYNTSCTVQEAVEKSVRFLERRGPESAPILRAVWVARLGQHTVAASIVRRALKEIL